MAGASVVAAEIPHLAGKAIENYQPRDEEIATYAYQIFLERGATDGHDVEDWLRAEKELREQNDKRATTVNTKS
jgi:hypothetical protein